MSGHVYGAGTNDTIATAWDARTLPPAAPENDAALHKRLVASVRDDHGEAAVEAWCSDGETWSAAVCKGWGVQGKVATASTYGGALRALEAMLRDSPQDASCRERTTDEET